MYPFAMYIRYGTTGKLYTVSVGGYREGISADGFRRLNSKVPYEMIQKVKSYQPYSYCYRINYQLEDCHTISEISDPIPLYEFYEMIGFDRKTKKFNGLTLLQHIKKEMKAA